MISFIGLGAQKTGTSWVYSCLYEHPQVCAPVKEIHFFSRPRYQEGIGWYEEQFKRCTPDKVCGEFSTSYLYSKEAANQIYIHYPNTKLIAIVREPIARAYSQYGNALKAGEIRRETTFEEYVDQEPSCLAQGLYTEQLQRYFDLFPRDQIMVLVYEDMVRDPQHFMSEIYRHIGVDPSFVPPSLYAKVNIARQPKSVLVDRVMHRVAEKMRHSGLDRLVHKIKTSGLTDWIRAHNTVVSESTQLTFDRSPYTSYFRADAETLGQLLGRDLVTEWNL